jgi:hypothetical protein
MQRGNACSDWGSPYEGSSRNHYRPANRVSRARFGDWSADRKDVLDAKLCRLAKPLAGDRIVRVRAELSE